MSEPYGKFYAKTFTGSMRGAGSHVIALMAYAVSHAKPPDGEVEINVDVAAFLIGDSRERIQSALDYLCAPDEASRTKDEDGRRLVQVGQFKYKLVTWMAHREGVDDDSRRKYWREKQAERRAKIETGPSISGNSRFQKPTIDELSEYASEIGFHGFLPQKFLDHYDANGWRRGKTPIKDWKACVRTWKSNTNNEHPSQNQNGSTLSDAEILRQSQM